VLFFFILFYYRQSNNQILSSLAIFRLKRGVMVSNQHDMVILIRERNKLHNKFHTTDNAYYVE